MMETHLINFTEILKEVHEKKIKEESQSVELLKTLFMKFQDIEILRKRYLNNNTVEIDNTKVNFVEIEIIYSFDVSKEEVVEYCLENKIDHNKIYFNNDYSKCTYLETINANSLKNEIIQEIRKRDYEKTAKFIKTKTIDFKETEYQNLFLLPIDNFNLFMKLFKDSRSICWESISSFTNIIWTEEIIELGKKRWDWSKLFANKSIAWNTTLIIKYIDHLENNYYSSINQAWTISDIEKLIPYFKELKPYRIGKFGKKEVKSISQDTMFLKSLSSSHSVIWNLELINHFHLNWDWDSLSRNESISWNRELIDKFSNHINYRFISSNKNVNWNIDLIRKYSDKLDLNNLIFNNSIVWTNELFEIFGSSIDFKLIAKHSNISEQSIIRFEDTWDKVDTVTNHAKRNSDGSYSYLTTHTLWEYLSQNKNIRWSDNLIIRFIDKLKIHGFNSTNLFLSVEIINTFWQYEKREQTSYWESYDRNVYEDFANIKFRDNIKDVTIIDLTIDKFKENEINWYGVLNSSTYTNKSISKLLENIV